MVSTTDSALEQDLYRAVFRQAAVGIARVAPDGTWIEVNQRLCEIVGYDEQELRARTFQDITHPDDLDADMTLVKKTLTGEIDTYSMEKRYLDKAGNVVWVNLTVSLVRDHAGAPRYFISIIEDTTARKHAEQQKREADEQLRLLVEHAPTALAMFDRHMRYVVVSARWTDDYDLHGKDIIGRRLDEIASDLPLVWRTAHSRALAGEVIRTEEYRFDRKDGTVQWLRWVVRPWHTASGEIGGIIVVTEDVTDKKIAYEQLRHLAHHDTLTGLPNRRLLNQRLMQSIKHAQRRQQHVAVLFVDIDHFKHINDGLGHETGDHVLKDIGQRLTHAVRDEDSVARISGDEFVVLLESVPCLDNVLPVADKLVRCFSDPVRAGEREIRVTASIGVSIFPQDGHNAAQLLRNADAAMYSAKSGGRDQYRFYSRHMTDLAIERLFYANAMQDALRQSEFSVAYQPQVELSSGRLVGMEALIRWRHATRGNIPPSVFIPFAEQNGMIRKINHWILHTVCTQGARWLASGMLFGRIAVNISGPQIEDGHFVDQVVRILDETGLPADRLEMELTESLVMRHTSTGFQQLQALRDLGVQIAIDDFGTGYSSLSYLKQLPVDKLKIDQSFVHDIPDHSDDNAITEAIIALANALDMQVIAEGIETDAQMRFLCDKGCNLAQGFLFSRPLSAADMTALCGTAGTLWHTGTNDGVPTLPVQH